ncbi:hypothetical protein B5S33_g1249 [[Candida] boidinii]|nr:hypothetical protein B5S33_g1249 [[Candida] boidinii]
MSDKDKALDILHEISLKVAPIIRKHNFQVGLLCEFYPKDNRLLGLNVNKGSKICIRLRYPNNNSLFLPMSELIGTMLHELTHNLFGPHDDKFYKQLDELKEEFYDIQIRGSIKSTGYIAFSEMLGGSQNVINHRSSRIQKLSQVKYKSEVNKLGSDLVSGNGKHNNKKVKDTRPLREIMLEAIQRRLEDNKVCHNENEDDKEKEKLVPDESDLIEIIGDDEDEERAQGQGQEQEQEQEEVGKKEQKSQVVDSVSDKLIKPIGNERIGRPVSILVSKYENKKVKVKVKETGVNANNGKRRGSFNTVETKDKKSKIDRSNTHNTNSNSTNNNKTGISNNIIEILSTDDENDDDKGISNDSSIIVID